MKGRGGVHVMSRCPPARVLHSANGGTYIETSLAAHCCHSLSPATAQNAAVVVVVVVGAAATCSCDLLM